MKKFEYTSETLKTHEISNTDYAAIVAFCEDHEFTADEWVGIRFEELDRKIGDVCANSKHNRGREDERDFPAYGTVEYEDLEDLDGTSTWHYSKRLAGSYLTTDHCYIVASPRVGSHDEPDDDEVLLKSPKVIAKLF